MKALRARLAKRQAIEHENLDHAILVAVPPLQRHSCRVLELRREHPLAAMKQYDDAKNVRGCSTRSRPGAAQVRRDDTRADVAHENTRSSKQGNTSTSGPSSGRPNGAPSLLPSRGKSAPTWISVCGSERVDGASRRSWWSTRQLDRRRRSDATRRTGWAEVARYIRGKKTDEHGNAGSGHRLSPARYRLRDELFAAWRRWRFLVSYASILSRVSLVLAPSRSPLGPWGVAAAFLSLL